MSPFLQGFVQWHPERAAREGVSQPSRTGPRQLVLCPAVPQSSLGFSFPNLASEEVQIPPLCPKTSRGALCVLEYTSCSSSSSRKSKNGRFLTASLWFLFPKPYSFSQGHKAPVVPDGSCPHLESRQQSRLGRLSLGSEAGSAPCLRPCTLLSCGNSSGRSPMLPPSGFEFLYRNMV